MLILNSEIKKKLSTIQIKYKVMNFPHLAKNY